MVLSDNGGALYLEYHNQYVYQFKLKNADLSIDCMLEYLVYNFSKYNSL